MTAASTLLTDLRAAGFTLTVNGDRLDVGPGSRLTAEQATMIRQHRDELFALVRSDAAATAVGNPAGPKAHGPAVWVL